MEPETFELNFGKGGYKGKSRVLLDTIVFQDSNREHVNSIAEFLRNEMGYWTVINNISKKRK